MTAREWAGLIVISLLGILAIAWISPLVSALPPWIPLDTLNARTRLRGGASPGLPGVLPYSSAINVFIVGALITLACICLYSWWITRPLAIRFAPRKERDP